jgi:hypothetical protein
LKNFKNFLNRRLFLKSSLQVLLSQILTFSFLKSARAGGFLPFAFLKQSAPMANGSRGIFAGGDTASGNLSAIEYITFTTPGNPLSYGSLSVNRGGNLSGTSNASNGRGVFAGGYTTAGTNLIEYISLLILGNASNFGTLTSAKCYVASHSNGTSNRGVIGGGTPTGMTAADVNTIDYITISVAGNATSFGTLDTPRDGQAGFSNGINNRGIFAGGTAAGSYPGGKAILYTTITTPSNSTSFGTSTTIHAYCGGLSNDINQRGVIAGGGTAWNTTAVTNSIEYITISTTGNATSFGTIATAKNVFSGTSNRTGNIGIFAGGMTSATFVATSTVSNIESITISTTGNASNFGQLTTAKFAFGATS